MCTGPKHVFGCHCRTVVPAGLVPAAFAAVLTCLRCYRRSLSFCAPRCTNLDIDRYIDDAVTLHRYDSCNQLAVLQHLFFTPLVTGALWQWLVVVLNRVKTQNMTNICLQSAGSTLASFLRSIVSGALWQCFVVVLNASIQQYDDHMHNWLGEFRPHVTAVGKIM